MRSFYCLDLHKGLSPTGEASSHLLPHPPKNTQHNKKLVRVRSLCTVRTVPTHVLRAYLAIFSENGDKIKNSQIEYRTGLRKNRMAEIRNTEGGMC
jgi:hypothetical protein